MHENTCMHACTHAHTHPNARMHACMHARTHALTHTHTHTIMHAQIINQVSYCCPLYWTSHKHLHSFGLALPVCSDAEHE